ncbi:MAG: sulfatase [Acidobacteriota bacterium]
MSTLLARRISVLALAAGVGTAGACRREPPPRSDAPTLIRLEPLAGRAELLGDGFLTKRRAIPASVPSILSWPVRVPAGGRLETHLSFTRSIRDEPPGLACDVRVGVGEAGASEPVPVVERHVAPRGPWEPYIVDLDPWRDQDVQLSLSVDCSSGEGKRTWSDAVRWSVPVISGRRPEGVLNVLLLTVDTLRSDHLGAYGYARPTSPNIDRLARRGLLFRQAETPQSATWPALTSLHTSLYPSAHGVVWNGHDMPPGMVTLAGLLHSRNYSTSAFLSNMKRARHPGFARVSGARAGDQAGDDLDATRTAIEQLRLEKDRPFFLWLHLIGPHAGYTPPPPWDTAFVPPGPSTVRGELDELVRIRQDGRPLAEADVAHVVGRYDGEVGRVDELLGQVLDTLCALDLETSTLVVFSADHGEDLYEHNQYFFHSPSMYDSSLDVPLILSLPGILPEGVETDQPASLVDLAPTILSLVGLPAPTSFQGRDLLPGGALASAPGPRPLFSETNGRIYGVRVDGWRLIFNPEDYTPGAPGGAYPIAPVELYDLAADPREQRNVAADHPDRVEALTAQITSWRNRDLREDLPSQEIAPETLEELQALGYVFE